jgi:ATP-dependent DNA helicase RecQ
VISPSQLLGALSRHWGYTSFRPGQEAIAHSIAEGRDACVVMPTGGGKSLCYQLPAALAENRTAVVISPLIALMQDQVAQLEEIGIPAALLNSSLSHQQREQVKRGATEGRYRLLYLSPEAIVQQGMLRWLKQLKLSSFVIDEAHCISEWGHDFRPEYRQLSRLRAEFPEQPIAAFTASATQRVRRDIVQQLSLRDPFKHIASFRRPNLRYLVKQCDRKTQDRQLVDAIARIPGGSIIVYSPTIARVGETLSLLDAAGIPAAGYHGKMESAARRANQEKWMCDEVRVMVSTLAFGLGINKATVRGVIHLAMPKSVEHYYQESGRAGRDGLQADCLLFWRKGDASLQAHFIRDISDENERVRARQRLDDICEFVEARECRQWLISNHFGERSKQKQCGMCDACKGLPDWLSAEVGRKVPRGVNRAALETSVPARMSIATAAARTGADLRKTLREWRRNMAQQKGVPAYVILHDSALDELSDKKPATLAELRRVSGFGEKRSELYGSQILEIVAALSRNNRVNLEQLLELSGPARETLQLLDKRHSFEEIARIRGVGMQTVVTAVSELVQRGDVLFRPDWISQPRYDRIRDVGLKVGWERLKPIKEALPEEFTYDEIRLVAAHQRVQMASAAT